MSRSKLLATVCAVAALSASAAIDPARAAGAQDGAIVFHGGTCRIPARAGFPALVATDAHLVLTPSGNGSLKCHAQLPPGTEPTSAVTIDISGNCRLADGAGGTLLGTEGSVTYAPSGSVNLTCQFKK